MTPVPRLLATVSAIAAVCATAAADAPSGGEPRFRKVFAFTDIGDDEHAAKLAELNVFAANCCDAGNRPDPEKIERAKRFGIVPYVAFGPFCGSHVQALSPEEARLQAELQGRFVPSEAKGDAGDRGRTDLWRTRHYRLGGEPEPGNAEVYVESIGCFVGTNACAKGAAGLVERLKANPEAKAVCLDYIGYANYRGCRHPDCLRLLGLGEGRVQRGRGGGEGLLFRDGGERADLVGLRVERLQAQRVGLEPVGQLPRKFVPKDIDRTEEVDAARRLGGLARRGGIPRGIPTRPLRG